MDFNVKHMKYNVDRQLELQQQSPYNYHHQSPTVGHHTTKPNSNLSNENLNENYYNNRGICTNTTCPQQQQQTSASQTISKVDAATMTDPLRINFKIPPEYVAHCSNVLGLPYVCKYEDDNDNSSSQNYQQSTATPQPKLQYNVKMENSFRGPYNSYPCPECAYRFTDHTTFQEHLEEHRQRPYICDICGASLKRKEHLDRHRQGHNKDRPYQCNVCCKAFKRNEHLARHMITHSGNKNQICPECGKAFFRKDHLKKHMLSHSGIRNKIIEDRFNDPNSIKDRFNDPNSIKDRFNDLNSIKDRFSDPNSIKDSNNIHRNNNHEGLNMSVMMRQAGPVTISNLRT